MDPMIQAVRVALLLVVTGIFAALWSGDRSDMAAAKPPSNGGYGTQNELISKSQSAMEHAPKAIAGHVRDRSSSDSVDFVPLPDGIVAGTYLVADRFGRTRMRSVSTEQALFHRGFSSGSGEGVFSVTGHNGRWHFIRLDEFAGRRAENLPIAIH